MLQTFVNKTKILVATKTFLKFSKTNRFESMMIHDGKLRYTILSKQCEGSVWTLILEETDFKKQAYSQTVG